ncbi:uncharacterized protein LOC108909362 isoform X1 [Anoplophora glabripennis]|uniref:uncharacterized protein LOC108909362 isoform X1 n=1 Tax=Anoplophora glabripennis TaxID=217634 RepID=UPI0008736934|nr:uncharacterized protein LOC108909362 isoform X1 [Anoplophora glabripennis]
MEEAFTRVVQHVFNNWTALKLAVEHSMGGPNSKQTAVECMNYMVQYCLYEPSVDVLSIEEALEDILDEEFETVCEDNSPKEVAAILFKFIQLIKEGNVEQCEIEYQKLPTMNADWLNQLKTQSSQTVVNDDSSSEDEQTKSQTAMEQDGWTEVKTRKKR